MEMRDCDQILPVEYPLGDTISPPQSLLRPWIRPIIKAARAAPLWGEIGWRALSRQSGLTDDRGLPVVVFLPAYGREGAALLRIYNIAAQLRMQGCPSFVVSWRLTLAQRRRLLAAITPDVVIMQGARHPLNRPHLYPGQRILFDMDDADFHLDHLKEPVTAAMGQVDGVIAGSKYIADWGLGAGAPRADVVWTGTPPSDRPIQAQKDRAPVVAWAQTRPMTYTREAEMVRRVMKRVAEQCPGVTLRLYDRLAGDDPGFADSFAAPGLRIEWVKRMPYKAYLASLDRVAIGLAPLCPQKPFCRGKSFGKVLAYLDRGVPVVASDAGEHAGFFTNETGILANNPQEWAEAIVRLLENPSERAAMARVAREAFKEHLSDDAAARRVGRVLQSVILADRIATVV